MLKEINDEHGHKAGDQLLCDLAEAIRSRLRSYDPVVRWGGDEFVCALSDVDLDSAERRFDEVARALKEKRGASFSLGLAALRPDDPSPR